MDKKFRVKYAVPENSEKRLADFEGVINMEENPTVLGRSLRRKITVGVEDGFLVVYAPKGWNASIIFPSIYIAFDRGKDESVILSLRDYQTAIKKFFSQALHKSREASTMVKSDDVNLYIKEGTIAALKRYGAHALFLLSLYYKNSVLEGTKRIIALMPELSESFSYVDLTVEADDGFNHNGNYS